MAQQNLIKESEHFVWGNVRGEKGQQCTSKSKSLVESEMKKGGKAAVGKVCKES